MRNEKSEKEEESDVFMMKFSEWFDSLEEAEDFLATNKIDEYHIVILWEEEVHFEKKKW